MTLRVIIINKIGKLISMGHTTHNYTALFGNRGTPTKAHTSESHVVGKVKQWL
jgi:hypothetical protein